MAFKSRNTPARTPAGIVKKAQEELKWAEMELKVYKGRAGTENKVESLNYRIMNLRKTISEIDHV